MQQPGRSFRYGISIDLLGAVVEKVSGQSLDAFIESRITGPLGMKDTGFAVPAEKRARVAKVYTTGKDGQLTEPKSLASGDIPYPDEQGRLFPSGGGGMFSTIGDYARFGQMLLNGGELDGVRILGRKTVELMEANHLSGLSRETLDSNDYEGFGLGRQRARQPGSQLTSRLRRPIRLERRGDDRLQDRSEGTPDDAGVHAALPVQRARSLLARLHADLRGARG